MNGIANILIRALLILWFPAKVFILSGYNPEKPPGRWDIKLHLNLTGRYSVNNSGEFDGEYAYEAVWTGSIEKDDMDFLLYHAKLENLRWEIREESPPSGAEKALTENDSPLKPVLRMNYILNEKELLHFNFIVEEFPVPLSASEEKFILVLPKTKNDGRDPKAADYELSIIKGSNDVVIHERDLQRTPLERSFQWVWKRYLSPCREKAPPRFMNAHQVEVKIKITPRH